MSFAWLVPLGLLALAAVPVVILLHMRNTIPTERPIPTLRFWLVAAPERSETRRFKRPPLTILLLLQLLIVGLIAAGLGRPAAAATWSWLGVDLRAEREHVIVLLDGSTSMTATDTPGGETRWDAARRAALDEISALREGDAATVLLLGTRTTTLEATDAGGFESLRDRLATLEPPGGRADIDAGLDLAAKLILPGLANRVVVVSDGAITADPLAASNVGAPIAYRPVGPAAGGLPGANVGITRISARPDPGQPDRELLYTRVANFSPEPVQVPVVLLTDGIEASRQDVQVPGNGGVSELQWLLPAGVGRVDVTVSPDDALPADDTASLILRQEADLALDILLVTDIPGPLLRALEVLPGARVTVEAPGGPAALAPGPGYDLLVYENATPAESLPDAALLLVRPPVDGGPFATRGQMESPSVVGIAASDPLLAGVDVSGLTFGPTPVYETSGDQTAVLAGEAGPLLFRGEFRGLPMVAITFDLAASNLTQRVAFPILVANVAGYLVPNTLPPAVALGDPLTYTPGNGAATVEIAPPAGEPVRLAVTLDDQTSTAAPVEVTSDRLGSVAFADTGQPGVYAVTEYDAAGQPLGGGRFVVNAGHETESDLRVTPGLAETFALAGGDDGGGAGEALADLWPLLVAAALAVLAVEWLVAVWPRRVRARRPSPSPTLASPLERP